MLFVLGSFFSFHLYASEEENILAQMSLEEKIGQLFIIPMSPTLGEDHFQELETLIKAYHLGGVIAKKATPSQQVNGLNRLQGASALPLLVTVDAEWGLGMRMEETLSFPRNLTLGAIQDDSLIEELGEVIGNQVRAVGGHLNFAPVADVNSNPENPVIHTRSFGEDPEKVAQKVLAFVKGMSKSGVLACAKHFLGHGDTNIDSHQNLPTIPHSMEHLENVELKPFKTVIGKVPAIMTGHLFAPSLDTEVPVSLSPKIVQNFLKKQLGHEGLTIPDALNMKALTRSYPKEEIAKMSFLAGHDLLLYGDHLSENVKEILQEILPIAYNSLVKAVESGEVSIERLDESVLKILKVKQQLGLFTKRETAIDPELHQTLHAKSAYHLKKRLFEEALTLVSKKEGSLPLSQDKHYAFVKIGKKGEEGFFNALQKKGIGMTLLDVSLEKDICFSEYDGVIVQITGANGTQSNNFGLSKEESDFCKGIKEEQTALETIFAHFGTPYAVSILPKESTILVGYEVANESFDAMADVLVGEKEAKGKLPVTVSPL